MHDHLFEIKTSNPVDDFTADFGYPPGGYQWVSLAAAILLLIGREGLLKVRVPVCPFGFLPFSMDTR